MERSGKQNGAAAAWSSSLCWVQVLIDQGSQPMQSGFLNKPKVVHWSGTIFPTNTWDHRCVEQLLPIYLRTLSFFVDGWILSFQGTNASCLHPLNRTKAKSI
jgi:hypothetical protein